MKHFLMGLVCTNKARLETTRKQENKEKTGGINKFKHSDVRIHTYSVEVIPQITPKVL